MPAIQRVLESTSFIQGPEVLAFEQAFAGYLGASEAVGVASGTAALHLALLACGIGPGDEVITTPLTFYATAEAVVQAGATPVFVDILPDSYNIDPAKIEAAITPRTRAPSCRCTSTARQRTWTRSAPSPGGTTCG